MWFLITIHLVVNSKILDDINCKYFQIFFFVLNSKTHVIKESKEAPKKSSEKNYSIKDPKPNHPPAAGASGVLRLQKSFQINPESASQFILPVLLILTFISDTVTCNLFSN